MDINKVGALLIIAEKAAAHSTALSGIYSEAMGELGEINADAIKDQQARTAKATEEATRRADRSIQTKADEAKALKEPASKTDVIHEEGRRV